MACQSPHYDYRFHHTHVFVDSIKPLAEYKQLEAALNALAKKGSFDPMSGQVEFLVPDALQERIAEARAHWTKLMPGAKDPKVYKSQSQDFVTQLIAGTGWRVTAEHVGEGTRSLLVCSEDPCGAKMVVTAKTRDVADEPYNHFNSSTVQRFHDMHAGRQGIAVLGFECAPGKIDEVFANYQKLHPKLLASELNVHKDTRVVNNGSKQRTIELGSFKAMEVFAYYLPNNSEDADKGTLIRFVERTGSYSGTPGFGNPHGVLPGLVNVPAEFDGTSCSSYSDHWVSNVDDRNRFLNTLKDTLGFMPKVDFNAGVVAAGEAIIESTVTGNTSELNTQDLQVAFEDQSQVYLPINNALSPVGHVAGYIKEIGQGVQHLAQRVKNLSQFIERVSNYREITGEGFTFLRIPRSYYGRLTTQTLVKKGGVSEGLAKAVFDALVAAGNLTLVGIIDMDIQPAQVEALVLPAEHQAEFKEKVAVISMLVLRSRYENIFALLRDLISDEEYVRIVRHQVLVDIQGNDILYQIFTSNILQRNVGEESPFLEFIQRVCASNTGKKIRAGCGGFGIRNFLTLFLSIEVSKAMLEYDTAVAAKDDVGSARAQKMVEAFTEQLDVSNPILTQISDCMTLEADSLEAAEKLPEGEEKAKHLAVAEEQRKIKEGCNEDLKVTSNKYKELLKSIRQS